MSLTATAAARKEAIQDSRQQRKIEPQKQAVTKVVKAVNPTKTDARLRSSSSNLASTAPLIII